MAMSQEHKDVLARGRQESRAIKAYLQALSERRPGRPVTNESVTARIKKLDSRLESETDPLKKVDLLQQRLDAEQVLKSIDADSDLASLEEGFVAAVAGYSQRKGITYAAWRAVGVPARVLREAGIVRSA